MFHLDEQQSILFPKTCPKHVQSSHSFLWDTVIRITQEVSLHPNHRSYFINKKILTPKALFLKWLKQEMMLSILLLTQTDSQDS